MSKTDKVIKDCVEQLIGTLGSMDAEQADAVVKQVATTLMNDVLGKSGYVKRDFSGYLTKRTGCQKIVSYKWEEL